MIENIDGSKIKINIIMFLKWKYVVVPFLIMEIRATSNSNSALNVEYEDKAKALERIELEKRKSNEEALDNNKVIKQLRNYGENVGVFKRNIKINRKRREESRKREINYINTRKGNTVLATSLKKRGRQREVERQRTREMLNKKKSNIPVIIDDDVSVPELPDDDWLDDVDSNLSFSSGSTDKNVPAIKTILSNGILLSVKNDKIVHKTSFLDDSRKASIDNSKEMDVLVQDVVNVDLYTSLVKEGRERRATQRIKDEILLFNKGMTDEVVGILKVNAERRARERKEMRNEIMLLIRKERK